MNYLLLAIFGNVLVGLSSLFVQHSHLTPATLGFYRLFFTLLILLFLNKNPWEFKSYSRRSFIYLALGSLGFMVDIWFWQRSLALIGPALATLLGGLQIYLVPAYAWLVLRERPSATLLLSVLLSGPALYLIVSNSDSALSSPLGLAFAVISGVGVSAYVICSHTYRDLKPDTAMSVHCGFSALGFLLVALGRNEAVFNVPLSEIVWALAYAVCCQCLGWLVIQRSYKKLSATVTALLIILQPVCAIITEAVMKKSGFGFAQTLGFALLLFCFLLAGLRPKPKLRREAQARELGHLYRAEQLD